MNEFMDSLGEILFVICAVGIPAGLILGRPFIKRWLDIREKQASLGTESAAERSAQYAAHKRIEARLRVLEQIVTDGGVETAAQIEALRAPRLPKEENV